MASKFEKKIKSGMQFQIRYRIDGQQKTKTFTSKGFSVTAIKNAEREANRFLKEIEAELALGLAKNETDMNFYDCVHHVYNLKFKKLEQSTIDNYTVYINQICERFGKMKLKSITSMMIENFFANSAKTKSRRVLKFYWSILNTTLEYAYKKDLISENPMLKVEFIEPEQQKKKKKVMPIAKDDLDVLFAYIDLIKYLFLAKLLLYTGMRVGEAQAITWDDIDYKKKIIVINKSYKRHGETGTTKTKRSRIVILHNAIMELLEEIKYFQEDCKKKFGATYQDNNSIICNEDGSYMKYSAIRSYFRRLDKKINAKIRTHRFRHTFASTLILKEGLNPKVVQKLLGHQKISTTLDIYTDLFNNEYDEATYGSLDNAFSEEKENYTTIVQQI